MAEIKTEHNGAKNSSAKGGWRGRRAEAKEVTKAVRRGNSRKICDNAKKGMVE